jgi:hypothetical protein
MDVILLAHCFSFMSLPPTQLCAISFQVAQSTSNWAIFQPVASVAWTLLITFARSVSFEFIPAHSLNIAPRTVALDKSSASPPNAMFRVYAFQSNCGYAGGFAS